MQKTELHYLKQRWFYLHLANLVLSGNSTKSAPLNGHYPNFQYPTYTLFSHADTIMHTNQRLTFCGYPVHVRCVDMYSPLLGSKHSQNSIFIGLSVGTADDEVENSFLARDKLTGQLLTQFLLLAIFTTKMACATQSEILLSIFFVKLAVGLRKDSC